MKILVISNLYPPVVLGGYEIGCAEICEQLSLRNHEVLVLTSNYRYQIAGVEHLNKNLQLHRSLQMREFQADEHIRFYSDPRIRAESLVLNYHNLALISASIIQFQPDQVYLFNLVGLGGIGIVSFLNERKIPWTIHLMDRTPVTLKDNIPNAILQLFDADLDNLYNPGQIISCSYSLIHEIQHLGIRKFTSNVHIIPVWARKVSHYHSRTYYRNDRLNIIFVGVLFPLKGIDILLEVLKKLVMTGRDKVHLTICGKGDRALVGRQITQLGLQKYVLLAGHVEKVALEQFYLDSDILVFPTSNREPFGFVPVEAAASGCVPVINGIAGCAERMIHEIDCIKFIRNESDILNSLIKIYDRSYDLGKIGSRAKRRVEKGLLLEHCMEKILNVLEMQSNKVDYKYVISKGLIDYYAKYHIMLRMIEENI
jgi:glycogen(starch) synthase